MYRFIIAIILFFSISFAAKAQQNVQIVEDITVANLMNRFVELNQMYPNISGWRIQLLATNDRLKMESSKQSFQYRYPNIAIKWLYNNPYFKLQAGAFANKSDMTRVLYMLRKDYPGAYPVMDDAITPQELLSN